MLDRNSTALDSLGEYQVDDECKEKAIEVITRPLPKSMIKTRKVGKTWLKYISGSAVIDLLNDAFGYSWSFEVIRHDVIQSEDKAIYDWDYDPEKGRKVKTFARMEAQAPYISVLGRLTVGGFGVKEQYGSQVLLGGASEQMSALKGATTDALKKCATLMGIASELYDDHKEEERPVPIPAAPAPPPFDPKDVKELQTIKEKLKIEENNQLNEYVVEFTGNKDMTYKDITPTNIASFNNFLKKKDIT